MSTFSAGSSVVPIHTIYDPTNSVICRARAGSVLSDGGMYFVCTRISDMVVARNQEETRHYYQNRASRRDREPRGIV